MAGFIGAQEMSIEPGWCGCGDVGIKGAVGRPVSGFTDLIDQLSFFKFTTRNLVAVAQLACVAV